jgi:hypothetical protein
MRYIHGCETKEVEKEESHALEVGEEKAQAHQEKAEEARRRTVISGAKRPNRHYFFSSFINF